MHILFADDNYETCELFTLAFRREKVSACIAHSGMEAVEAVRAGTDCFDAIVLDIEMPCMDGWATFESIRELPQGQGVPILFFTGYSTAEDEAHAMRIGAAAFLTKPLIPQELLHELYAIVGSAHEMNYNKAP